MFAKEGQRPRIPSSALQAPVGVFLPYLWDLVAVYVGISLKIWYPHWGPPFHPLFNHIGILVIDGHVGGILKDFACHL